MKQPSLALAGNQGRRAALALTIQECIEERDQGEMAMRMMQLQVKLSGGLVAGDARTSAGTLLFARPWREWLEKPPLTGSSSEFVEGGEAGWLQELLCFENSP